MIWLVWLCFVPAAPDAIDRIAASGRVLEIAVTASEKVSPKPQIAPGQSPALSFRVFEGRSRHRFGDLDLVMDDAGH